MATDEITPQRERSVADLPVIQDMASMYGLDAAAFVFTFKAVAMPQPHTDPEFVSCCMVAHQHGLNPLTKEIYFMRDKHGKIQAIVSVDGWIKKCNEHPQFDGIEFKDNVGADGALVSIACSIYRKDRSRPTSVTEYMVECRQPPRNGKDGPWQTVPNRMLRNRTICQTARVAFGFAGIMDRDEFDQWQTTSTTSIVPAATAKAIAARRPPPPPPVKKPDAVVAVAAENVDQTNVSDDGEPDKQPDIDGRDIILRDLLKAVSQAKVERDLNNLLSDCEEDISNLTPPQKQALDQIVSSKRKTITVAAP